MKTKKQYQAACWKRRFEKEQKRRFSEEDFIDELKSVMSAVKPLPPLPDYVPKGSHKPHEAVLLFSDSQIGEKVQAKETGFWDYNFEVFRQELKNLFVAINNIAGIHRNDYRVDKLNIFFLGDIIEGSGNVYLGQGSRIVTDVYEQAFDVAIPEIAAFIQGLAKNFKEIFVTGVVGNHGRIRRKDEDLSYVSWDLVVYKMVECMLKGLSNVSFDIDKRFQRIVKIFDWNFLLEHGNKGIVRYLRLPTYGFHHRDADLTLLYQMKGQAFHYYCIGHHHTPLEWCRPEGERIINGTFVGGNAYALQELGTAVHPIQKLFFVHPEMGKVCSYNIRLDPPREYVE